jgi:hypothetical protein
LLRHQRQKSTITSKTGRPTIASKAQLQEVPKPRGGPHPYNVTPLPPKFLVQSLKIGKRANQVGPVSTPSAQRRLKQAPKPEPEPRGDRSEVASQLGPAVDPRSKAKYDSAVDRTVKNVAASEINFVPNKVSIIIHNYFCRHLDSAVIS